MAQGDHDIQPADPALGSTALVEDNLQLFSMLIWFSGECGNSEVKTKKNLISYIIRESNKRSVFLYLLNV